MPRSSGLLPGLLACAAALSTAGAQKPAPAVVRAQVTDTAHAPMANAAVAIIRGRDSVMQAGITNATGRFTFTFQTDSALHRVTARRIGYLATTRLVRAAPGDTIDVVLVLARLPPMLDTVRVDARARSDDYHIDATMIAHIEHHYVKDAYDAMRDINPAMLGDGARGCRRAENIWVNGVKVKYSPGPAYDMPVEQSVVTHANILGIPGATTGAAGWPAAHAALDDILALVRPQDIASIDYRNCWDNSMPGRGMRNAIFLTLKPGIDFDDRHGSYPHDSIPGR